MICSPLAKGIFVSATEKPVGSHMERISDAHERLELRAPDALLVGLVVAKGLAYGVGKRLLRQAAPHTRLSQSSTKLHRTSLRGFNALIVRNDDFPFHAQKERATIKS